MSHEDLLSMLDLGTTLAPQENLEGGLEIEGEGKGNQVPATPPSETALVLDRWDRERGEACLERSPKLQAAELTPEAVADFHGAAFLMDPAPVENCTDQRRLEFIKQMLETPEFQALHQSTTLNELASELAANSMGESYSTLLKDDIERKKQPKKRGKPGAKPGQDMADEMGLLRAIGKAVQQAQQDVDDLQDMQRSLGGDAGTYGTLDAKSVADLFKKVRGNPILRRICELAGRFRRLAQSRQRQKATHGYDDMVGVELSGDVGRLLPVELAMLADPDFELDAMRRLVERQSMSREYRGVEKVAKGPVIFAVDESGSMHGERICHGKALALAMAWVARHQKRWCALVSWSSAGQVKTLALPPGKWDEAALLEWLSHFFNGGTEPPLDDMATIYATTKAPVGTTDVVFLTDGVCASSPDKQQRFREWKAKAKARVITLVLGSNSAGELEKVSDEVHKIRNIDTNEEAIGRCLSI